VRFWIFEMGPNASRSAIEIYIPPTAKARSLWVQGALASVDFYSCHCAMWGK
jgi:hypothetical protein